MKTHFLKIFCAAVVLSCLLSHDAFSVERVSIKVKEVAVRGGAGPYYPVVDILKKGDRVDVIESGRIWIKVKLSSGEEGWISRRAMAPARAKKASRKYAEDKGVGQVSIIEVTAATKGVSEFDKYYGEKYRITPELFAELDSPAFKPSELDRFKDETYLGKEPSETEGSHEEIGCSKWAATVGRACAARLASLGLVKDANLRKYISLVAAIVGEQSGVFDTPLHVFILSSDEINSYSTPGGYVFVTKGALDAVKNEAELAGLLGHEIAHLAMGHGTAELEKEATRIEAEAAFQEMEGELKEGKEKFGAFRDLDTMADEIYNFIISGRNREYEDEADRNGTLYAAAVGYAPDGLEKFIETLALKEGKKKAGLQGARHHRDPGERVKLLAGFIKKEGLGKGEDFADRFKARIASKGE